MKISYLDPLVILWKGSWIVMLAEVNDICVWTEFGRFYCPVSMKSIHLPNAFGRDKVSAEDLTLISLIALHCPLKLVFSSPVAEGDSQCCSYNCFPACPPGSDTRSFLCPARLVVPGIFRWVLYKAFCWLIHLFVCLHVHHHHFFHVLWTQL